MRRVAFSFIALVLCACSGGSSGKQQGPGPGPSETVTTTLTGIVVDELEGRPIAGVEVRAHGETATTGADGTFVLADVTVPKSRCALVARRAGYFVAGKAVQPVPDGTTRFHLRLARKDPQLVDASGGTVTMSGGAAVDFSAASFQRFGQPLDESVAVSARHLDPTAEDFDRQFPGDLRATRADGSAAMMVSFGVIQVELDDEYGEPVELDASRPATLAFPVPPSMLDRAPPTLPLWYFDEEAAIWKEEGTLSLEGDRYVGQVRHFTPWNADQAEDTAWVAGTVLCGDKPAPGVRISAGPNVGFTDEAGHFLIEVPANAPILVRVDDEIARAGATKLAGPIPPGETEDVGSLELDLCPAGLSGRVVDGDGGGPARATVRVSWRGGVNGVNVEATDGEGRFRTQVTPDEEVTVTVTTEDGATTTVTKRAPGSGGELDLGDIVVGGGPACTYWDIPCEPYAVALSSDGARLALEVYDQSMVEIRDARTGTLEHTLATGANSSLAFSGDGSRLLTGWDFGAGPQLWDVATGVRLREWGTELQTALLRPGDTTLLAVDAESGQLQELAVDDGALVRTFGYDTTSILGLMGTRAGGRQVVALHNASGQFWVTVWDLETDLEVTTFDLEEFRPLGSSFFALAAAGGVVAFGRAGTEEDGTVVDFLDPATGLPVAEPFLGPYPTPFAEPVAILPDGSAFVTRQTIGPSEFDLPRMFALPGMEVVRTLPWEPYDSIDRYVFSADGRFLAIVEYGYGVRMVDLASCR